MWYLIGYWLVRATMSDQTMPKPVAPTTLPALPVEHVVEPRTIADVEADLALAGFELNRHRSRRGDTVNTQEILAQRPALIVQEVNWLLEEWSALHSG